MKVVDEEAPAAKEAASAKKSAPPVKLAHPGAERSYVAAILLKNELIDTAIEDDLGMLTDANYRAVVSGIFFLYNQGWKDVSKETIANLADKIPEVRQTLMEMGGIEYLERICSYEMSVVNFPKTRETLKNLHARRKLVEGLKRQAEEIEALAEQDEMTTEELVRHAETYMADVSTAVHDKPDFIVVSYDPEEFLAADQAEFDAGIHFKGVTSNMPAYDEMMGGFGNGRLHVFGAPTGCHRKGQGILMFDGSIRVVEDIMVGDLLMGPDSQPRKVLSLHRGSQEMARIVPTKGMPWVVNLDHILSLVGIEGAKHSNRSLGNKGQIVDVSVREWMGWSKWKKHVHKIFRTGVNFQGQADLPVEPYLLGVLLGDGHMGSPVSVSSADHEIHAALEIAADQLGLSVSVKNFGTTRETSSIINLKGGTNTLTREIRALELHGSRSGNKFIPSQYKTASRHQRLDILAGLMDTDGSLHGTGYDFISKSETLASDVAFVARSLGFAAYMKPCTKSCQTGASGTYYRVSIDGDCSEIPLRIARKRADARRQKKDVLRTGFTVELLPAEDYFGFTVSGDHRYLLEDFTVTHNCGKSLLSVNWTRSMALGLTADDPLYKVGVIDTGELMYRDDWLPRLLACDSGVRIKSIQKKWYVQNAAEKEAVRRSLIRIRKNPILWEQMPDFDGPAVRAFIKRWVRRYGVQAVLFDNIKINPNWGGGKDVYNKVGDLAQYIKDAAVQCEIPVIAFIQLTSDATVTGRAKIGMKKPHVSMFAGGQRTLQNTDVGGVMDWEDYDDWANDNRMLLIQKGRNDRIHRKDEGMVCHGDLRRARLMVAENRLDGPLDNDGSPYALQATTTIDRLPPDDNTPIDELEAYETSLDDVVVEPTPVERKQRPSFKKHRAG
jgi:replicative DNA helicase